MIQWNRKQISERRIRQFDTESSWKIARKTQYIGNEYMSRQKFASQGLNDDAKYN